MEGPPDLAIEVVSPSSVEIDREDKLCNIAMRGSRFIGLLIRARKTIEAWRLEGAAYVQAGQGRGGDVVSLPPFLELQIPLGNLWRPV